MLNKKVVVIGGGLAGLSSAALLAHQGFNVTLIEKNKDLGGRARTKKAKGFTFDMGPSWYLMPEIAEKIFNILGYKTSDFFKLKSLPIKYKIFLENKDPLIFADDLKNNLATFENISPGSTQKIKELIEKTNAIYNIAVNDFLNKPYEKLSNFLHKKEIKNALNLLNIFNPFENYHDFIKKYVKDPSLQKVFEFHTVFLGGDPYHTPALYSMLIAADFKQKIWYPMGGVGKLVTALKKICQDLSVEIIKDATVSEINIDKKSSKILSVSGKWGSVTTDYVVNTMDYATFDQKLLPEKYREYSNKYWEERDYSISTILVYLGINKKLPKLTHHNFYFQNNWQKHFDTIRNTDKLPENPCFYLCAPSATDPSVAPNGKENLFLLIPTSTKTKEVDLDKYVNNVLEHVENVTKTKFKKDICYKEIYSSQNFANDYMAYKGNALGLAHTLKQSVFLRPRLKSKKLKNLYFAGQFTQPGVGIPMVLLSALYISNLLKNESF